MSVAEQDRANIDAFWRWIADHKSELARYNEPSGCSALDDAADMLHRYDRRLGFEVSESDGTIEVTITAHGRRQSLESVKRLVNGCPKIPGLRALAFRQPEGTAFEIEAAGRAFSPGNVYFEPMKGRMDPSSIGLMIFFQGGDDIPSGERLELARVMIQAILGEYETATRIDHLEVADVGSKGIEELIPLADISAYLKWFEKRNPPVVQ